MLRSKSSKPSSPATAGATAIDEWEVRPGGMLVQKRGPDAGGGAAASPPIPNIRVRVKHGSAYLDVYLSAQSTFGELKKLLSERTGLHPLDQKLVYKGKDRDSSAYLDIAGVKDRSKMILLEDSTAQAKRFLEMRRSARMEKAAKSISQIGLEVDKLALQVSALDAAVDKGAKVLEDDVLNLIELLMAQLIKLDGISADGEAKQQRGMQVRRVQKYVERLDILKIKNNAEQQKKQQQQQQQQSQPQQAATLDFFDSLFAPATPAASTATTVSSASSVPTPRNQERSLAVASGPKPPIMVNEKKPKPATVQGESKRTEEDNDLVASSEEEEIERVLADIPLGELQKARADGSHAPRSKAAIKPQSKPGRAHKNRPMEMSSKVPVGRFREVIQAPKKVTRDPRFESLCGTLDTEGFHKRYDFLFQVELPAEKKKLQKLIKKERDPNVVKELKDHVCWIDKQLRSAQQKKVGSHVLSEHIKKEKEAAKQGKQPYYLKKSEIRQRELVKKYEELKAAGKLDSFIEKRRKRNALKDIRYMPYRKTSKDA